MPSGTIFRVHSPKVPRRTHLQYACNDSHGPGGRPPRDRRPGRRCPWLRRSRRDGVARGARSSRWVSPGSAPSGVRSAWPRRRRRWPPCSGSRSCSSRSRPASGSSGSCSGSSASLVALGHGADLPGQPGPQLRPGRARARRPPCSSWVWSRCRGWSWWYSVPLGLLAAIVAGRGRRAGDHPPLHPLAAADPHRGDHRPVAAPHVRVDPAAPAVRRGHPRREPRRARGTSACTTARPRSPATTPSPSSWCR